MTIGEVFEAQGAFFQEGRTRSYESRLERLKHLEFATKEFEQELLNALYSDLGRSRFEAFLGELYLLYDEIKYARRKLRGWMHPHRVPTPMVIFRARSEIISEPLGRTLILGPWNYPAQLVLAPLVGALAAGNVAILKPSELAPATSRVLSTMISKYFRPEEVYCAVGDVSVAETLLELPFDHVFFTGGGKVGRKVMEAAAKHLCPVTLELGGKSPCIVADPVNLEKAIPRIVWGKFFNAGQTCVAPDYLMVPGARRQEVIAAIQRTIRVFFGENIEESPDFGRIISARHFDRLVGLQSGGTIVIGGRSNPAGRYLPPTVLVDPDPVSPLMQDEIFGPLLPVVTYQSIEEAFAFVKRRAKPLALYLFTDDRELEKRVVNEISFGGACVNDTMVHLGNPRLPFGGVGPSGMGRYHGKYSFDTFSHEKTVVRRSRFFDWKLRFPPYKDRYERLRKWM